MSAPKMDTAAMGRLIAQQAMQRDKPRKAKPDDSRDTLTRWERENIVGSSVRIIVPLRDTVEIKAHMLLLQRMAERVIAVCDAAVAGNIPERTAQLTARAEIHALSVQLNKHPTPRRT